jgi:predicted enzyme related to lactoylglutathione lyase
MVPPESTAMMPMTAHPPGMFCWPELATMDVAAAAKFYSAVLGWEVIESTTAESPYAVFRIQGRDVGAAYTVSGEERHEPPHWNSYVSVASTDDTASRATALGGTILEAPFDVTGAGRMAVLQDPTGAPVCLWEARQHIGAEVINEEGALCWTELSTTDPEAAARFYTGLFGWTAKQGPLLDEYVEFVNNDEPIGGMIQIEPDWGQITSNWMPYFAVADVDEALELVIDNGGSPIVPAFDVANVGRMAIAHDPQGALFGLFSVAEAA